jgi:hypothetical protein
VLARAAALDVHRYGLTLDLTRSPSSAAVTTRIEFGWRGPGPATVADLDATALVSADLNGRPLPPATYTPGALELAPLAPDNVLTVEAWVDLSADGYGVCGVDDPADGRRYVYTRGTHLRAPQILCCFPYANRAPIDIAVVAPSGWTCVGHTPAVEAPPAGEAGTWRFATTPPMSPEHVAVAAGPWATHPPGLHGRRTVGADLARSPAGRLAAACVAVQSDLLGIAYPWDRLELVFVPGYSALATSTPGVLVLDGPPRQQAITVAAYDLVDGQLVARRPIRIDLGGDAAPVPGLVGSPPPDLVPVNSPAVAYAKVRLDDRSRATIAAHLDQLDTPARATCWVAGWEMVADGVMPTDELSHRVERYAEREADAAVRDLLRSKVG